MGEPDSKPKGSAASSMLECVIFLVISLALMIPMIYVAGNDCQHIDDPHPLDVVFENPDHEPIMKALQTRNKNVVIVEADQNSGVVTFMKHYASSNKNHNVFLREYTEDPLETAYSVLRFAKKLVEDNLDLEEDNYSPKTWILFGFDC